MTPFTAIYRKEFRENRWMLLSVLSVCVTMIVYGCVEDSVNSILRWLENAKLLGLCIVGAAAALSYSTETEQKTTVFLRTMPLPGLTLLRGKLAWIATVTLLVFSLLYSVQMILNGYYLPFGATPSVWLTAAVSMIAWGLFFSTVCRSTLMAVLSTWLSQLVMLLLLATVFPNAYSTVFFGNYYSYGGVEQFFEKFHFSKYVLPSLISVTVLAVALYRAANFLDLSERKMNRSGNTASESKTAGPALLARLFGCETWGPFRALLWQSIRQSSTILVFGIIISVTFTAWNWFNGLEFVLMLSGGPVIHTHLYNVSGFLFIGSALIALGFSSAVFASDQENQRYRALAQHGISPGLVWWSRFLPFLVVYSMPVPMIVYLCHLYTHYGYSQETFQTVAVPVLLLYYMPLCFGTFYSIFFRDYIINVFLVLISTAFMMPAVGVVGGPGGFGSALATLTFLLGLLTASRLMTADWLREKPQTRRLALPATVLAAAFVTALFVAGCYELIQYVSGGNFM